MKIDEIVEAAAASLKKNGVAVSVYSPMQEVTDASLQHGNVLHVAFHQRSENLPAQVHRLLLSGDAPRLAPALDSPHTIHLAAYISEDARKELRRLHIPYLDSVGNISVEGAEFSLLIETGVTARQQVASASLGFSKTSLKVVFHLLTHPEHLNQPYRFLAAHAGVSLDAITQTFARLTKQDFLISRTGREKILIRTDELVNQWVSGYRTRLKPTLPQKRYALLQQHTLKSLPVPQEAAWSGAVAAEWLNDRLIATRGILYTSLAFSQIARELSLIPDPQGAITIIEPFWKLVSTEKTVHPLLVFADLLDGDEREKAEAQLIFDQYVKPGL